MRKKTHNCTQRHEKLMNECFLVSGRISCGWHACLFQSPAALPYQLVKVLSLFLLSVGKKWDLPATIHGHGKWMRGSV